MHAEIEFGYRPRQATFILPARRDFLQTVRANPGPWPPGTVLELEWLHPDADGPDQTVWTAEIDGDKATFHQPAAAVAAVRAAGARHAAVVYRNGDVELEYLTGPVAW